MIEMTLAQWHAEATRRFGEPENWRFVCPACKHEASCTDFIDLEADPERAAQECIGRVLNERKAPGTRGRGVNRTQPCDWAAFGLLKLADCVKVTFEDGTEHFAFPFAEVRTEIEVIEP